MVRQKRLLCIVYEPGNFQPWLNLARRGVECGDFDVILWSPYSLPESVRYQAEALAAGTVYVEETTPAGGLADIFTRLSGWLSAKPVRLPDDLQSMLLGPAAVSASVNIAPQAEALAAELPQQERYAVLCAVDRVRRRIHACEDWLVRLGIDAVILAEDNVERDSYGWIEGARRRRIRTVVSSYGAISAQEAVNAYKYSPDHALSPCRAALIRRCLPNWLAEGEDFAITRLPFHEMLARELTGVAPFNPWLVNSGHADVIALESTAMEWSYRQLGFPSCQLKAIGHPLQDVLAKVASEREVTRAALDAQYHLQPELPLAVVAMPPDQLATRQGEYQQYNDLVRAFACLPAELAGVNVLVSPHPNISAEGRALIRASGAALIESSVSDVLPVADLYVASVSSTIKWALGCGIPVINYDCYRYGYSDYVGLPQVISVTDEAAFRVALQRFGDPEQRMQLADWARQSAGYWGGFDGRATERLIELLFEGEIDGPQTD